MSKSGIGGTEISKAAWDVNATDKVSSGGCVC
jgi:hypothetical protein